jgi:hypothetical protein
MGLLPVLHGMTNLMRTQHISWLVVGVVDCLLPPKLVHVLLVRLCDAGLICGGRNQWRIVHYEEPVAFLSAVKQTCRHSQCLMDPKISYRVQSNLPLGPDLWQMNIASNSLPIIFK